MIFPRHLRILLLFLSSVICPFFLNSQIITLPGLALPEFSRETASKLDTVREEGWNPSGLQYIREIRFNPDGQTASETFYNPDGSRGSWISYLYDAENRLSRKEFHHPDARIPDVETYQWDEVGRLVSVARAYTTGMYGWRFEYTYDEKARLILATKIDRYWKDAVVWKKQFFYDEQGRISSSTGGGMDKSIGWRDEYRYGNDGLLAEWLKFDLKGDLVSHTFYGRDHKGRINREWQETPEGQRTGELHYYYRDDESGNWREKHVGRASVSGGARYFLPASWYLRSFVYRP